MSEAVTAPLNESPNNPAITTNGIDKKPEATLPDSLRFANNLPAAEDNSKTEEIKIEITGLGSIEKEKDNASASELNSDDVAEENLKKPLAYRSYDRDEMKFARKRGHRYAKATAMLIEDLEARVQKLEEEVLEREIEEVDKKGTQDEDDGTPQGPCVEKYPVESLAIGLQTWKKEKLADFKASVTISLSLDSSSHEVDFQKLHLAKLKTLSLNTHSTPTSHENTSENLATENPKLLRLSLTSPWLRVILELLVGSVVYDDHVWKHPFKHFVYYADHFRKYVELLEDPKFDTVSPESMVELLASLHRDVLLAVEKDQQDSDDIAFRVRSALDQDPKGFKRHTKKLNMMSQQAKDVITTTSSATELAATKKTNDNQSKTAKAESEVVEPWVCNCFSHLREHLKSLIRVVDLYLVDQIAIYKQKAPTIREVFFEDLWYLYTPGSIIVTSEAPKQAFRVLSRYGGRLKMRPDNTGDSERYMHAPIPNDWNPKMIPFSIDCMKLDFDGRSFGPTRQHFEIEHFHTQRSINRLSVYPIAYADEPDILRAELVSRGRKFAQLSKPAHKFYSGMTLTEPASEIESQVMVDFELAYRQPAFLSSKPQFGVEADGPTNSNELHEPRCPDIFCAGKECNRMIDDTRLDARLEARIIRNRGLDSTFNTEQQIEQLQEEQYMLLPSKVFGFCFKDRKWACLDINLLQDLKYKSSSVGGSAFESLVLPPGYKRTVEALVKNHSSGKIEETGNESDQVDIIRGKGKGLIILLHGVPGVGKTSTAESVAEYTGKPLFPMTCGDLGQTAAEVETNLENTFNLARAWNCILLLDEADVFLAKRNSKGDAIERNALVSVFLRVLEYYTGILFLSMLSTPGFYNRSKRFLLTVAPATNRIGSFDEAFISRIHVSLYYPELDEDSTIKVWEMNLDRLKKSSKDIWFKREDITAYAQGHWKDGFRWNGRQIRNAFQTAIALAEYDFAELCEQCKETGSPLPIKPRLLGSHFKIVAETSAQFDSYINSVMHGTYSESMGKAAQRNDKWIDKGVETATGKKYIPERATRPSPAASALTPSPPARTMLPLSGDRNFNPRPRSPMEFYPVKADTLEKSTGSVQTREDKLARFRAQKEKERLAKEEEAREMEEFERWSKEQDD